MTLPSSLPEWVASHYQVPIYRVLVNKQTALRVLSIGVELGYDQQSAAAQVSVASPTIPTWQPGHKVEIWLGYGGTHGGLQPVFTGEIEELNLAYFPHHVDLQAAGYLRRTQPRYADDVSWSSIEDGALWVELLRKSGVPRYQAANQGEGIVYGTRAPVTLRKGEAVRDLIDRLDQSSPTAMRTYEIGGIVFRSPVLGVPAGNPTYQYAQGETSYPVGRVLEVHRLDTVREVANHCTVTGLPDGDRAVFAERRASSPYVPPDSDGNERFVAYDFSSDLLETREQCDLVSQRYLIERNKRTDQISLRVPLNPYLVPGRTVGLRSQKLGLPSERPFWVRHVRHSFGADGATTELDLWGGAGSTGYLVGLDPIAAFTYTVSAETFLVGGTPTLMYTAVCDGSSSFDPDGTIASYAWSTSTGASGSGVIFTVGFTEAQWTAGPEVTLTVTDHDSDPTGPHHGSFTDTLSGDAGELITRTIYVAASGRADCTPDGGATWYSWTPDGAGVTVRSTPEIAPLDHSYFGLSDGRLFVTLDGLVTAPELRHSFGSAIECIWVGEADAARVWVGLANGEIWATTQADLGVEAGWYNAYTLPDPVNWLVESYLATGQVRACSGTNVYLTFDGFATIGVVTALPDGVCRRLALSFFGNYAAGSSTVPVVKEDRSPVPFPASAPGDARITAFAAEDALLAIDETGQSWISRGGATFEAAGSTGFGACGHVVRDGEQTAVFYAACAEGLAKSYTAGATWLPLADYAGAELVGLQVGYGAAPLVPPRRVRYLERTSEVGTSAAPVGNAILGEPLVSACTNAGSSTHEDAPPAGWETVAFDDTVPWTGFGGVSHPWQVVNTGIVGGGGWRYFRASDVNYDNTIDTFEQTLYRHSFVVPDPGADGPWATALLEAMVLINTPAPGGGISFQTPMELYLNGTSIPCPPPAVATPEVPGTLNAYVDPGLLVADGTSKNVLAMRAHTGHMSYVAGHRTAFKLTVCTDPHGVSLGTGLDGALYWRPTGECQVRFHGPEGPPADWNGPADPAELTTRHRRTFDAGLSPSSLPNEPGWEADGPPYGGIGSVGWPDPGVSSSYATFRHAIRLPASSSGGPYRAARLHVWKPSPTYVLWGASLQLLQINAVTLDFPDAAPSTDGSFDATIELDPSVLLPDAWNVLCLLLAPGTAASFWPWVSYLIRIEP